MIRPPKNYRWWQDHGSGWRDEVADRKSYMPIYHLQEIFLEEYFARVAPGKILEFGCGFGRHLEYLRRIPKLDVYGFDQSKSMVEGMRWARKPWREKHVMIGQPLHELPYADGEFDVVFTVSVLIHIRPQDLHEILREMWRVSGGHVLHIENNDTDETYVTSKEHDGCWAHDLKAAYAEAIPEADLEIAPSLFEIEDVYRATSTDIAAPVFVTPARAKRFLALDREISEELVRREKARSNSAQRTVALEERVADLDARASELVTRAKSAEEDREVQRERARGAEEELEHQRERAREAERRVGEGTTRLEEVVARATGLECEVTTARSALEEQRDRALVAEEAVASLRERAKQAEAASETLLERARMAEAANASVLDRAKEAEDSNASLLDRAREAESQIEPLLGRAKLAEGRVEGLLDELRGVRDTVEEAVARASRLAVPA